MHFPSAACSKFTQSCTQRKHRWKMHVSGVFRYLLESSCSAASSVQYEQSRWEVVWCGSNGKAEDAVRAHIASYRLQLAETLCISAVYSISDVYRNTEYRVSLIQRYTVSSSNYLWIFPFPKRVQLINGHNSLSSSFPTNNHLPASFFLSSVSPTKHQLLRLLHTPAEPPRLTPSSELTSNLGADAQKHP